MSEQGKTRSAMDTQRYWDTWQPRPSDKEWLLRHVGLIKNGGVWGTSECVFTVDHTQKQLVYQSGIKGQIYWRTARVAQAIGWSVVTEMDRVRPN